MPAWDREVARFMPEKPILDVDYIRLNDNPSSGGTADNGDGFLTLFEVAA